MSDADGPGRRWTHRALTGALLVLGVAVLVLLYALLSQNMLSQNVFSPGASPEQDALPEQDASQSVSRRAPSSAGTPVPQREARPQEARPQKEEHEAEEASPVSEDASTGEIIQVGVRNGCGRTGLAAQMRGYLVRHDFDVVDVGNYSSFDLDSSLVIDRVGNLRAARRVAAALGIPRRRVRQDLDSAYYLDASVLIGRDYRTLAPFRDDEEK